MKEKTRERVPGQEHRSLHGKPVRGPLLAALQEGQAFIGFYLVRNVRLESFRNRVRGSYLRLQLKDRSGVLDARLWQGAQQAAEAIRDGCPVKVDGLVERYNEQLQVQIRRIRVAQEGEVDRDRLLPGPCRDPAILWGRVREGIRQVRDGHLGALLAHFFDDPGFCTLLEEAPAARRVHHACRGGLLAHLYELLELAEPLLRLYPAIHRDLLLTGILLHDVGKLEEYTCDWDIGLSDAGRLLGHVVLSVQRVAGAIDRVEGFPPALRTAVLHLLVSHHGELHWGSPRRPKTLEAAALHYLDNLDAQVNRFDSLLAAPRGLGGGWTAYDRMLDRALFAGPEGTGPDVAGRLEAETVATAAEGEQDPESD